MVNYIIFYFGSCLQKNTNPLWLSVQIMNKAFNVQNIEGWRVTGDSASHS